MNGMRCTGRTARLAVLTATALAFTALYGGTPAARAAEDPVTATDGFYVNPDNPAAEWAAANPADGRAAAIAADIGDKPMAEWFGSWSGDIGEATGAYVGAAAAHDKLPVLVAYNIPDLDICASGAGGGAACKETQKVIDKISAQCNSILIRRCYA